jgi:hypothetical protein
MAALLDDKNNYNFRPGMKRDDLYIQPTLGSWFPGAIAPDGGRKKKMSTTVIILG